MGLGLSPSSNPNAVIGPASAANLNVPIFDGTTGKLISDSGYAIDSANTPLTVVARDGDGSFACNGINAGILYGQVLIGALDINAAGGDITLIDTSSTQQFITGTNSTQNFNLPSTAALNLGHAYFFRNLQTGTGTLVIKASGGNTLITLAPGTAAIVTVRLNSSPTLPGAWAATYWGSVITTAKKFVVTNSLTLAGTDGVTSTFPSTNHTVARTDAANTFTGNQTFSAIIIGNAQIRLKGYTVAGLPAGTQGDTAFVTDALGPTYLVAVVGGGAVVTPVFYNGTAWVCG